MQASFASYCSGHVRLQCAKGPPRHAAACRRNGFRQPLKCIAGPTVVVTREKGKNDKLIRELAKHDVQCMELPLIEHASGPERDLLPSALAEGGFDWVAVTSPEAAAVFIDAWIKAGRPQLRVAVVGAGSGEVLEQAGVTVSFTPSKATGKVMGAELPRVPGGTDTVLYPASVRASSDLQDSLAASGFNVRRLHTYDTVGVTDVAQPLLQQAMQADVVTFGSPSAVKAWVALVGLDAAQCMPSVCIGSTSAKACRSAGLSDVAFPESPGIQGWVESILAALQQRQRQPQEAAVH